MTYENPTDYNHVLVISHSCLMGPITLVGTREGAGKVALLASALSWSIN